MATEYPTATDLMEFMAEPAPHQPTPGYTAAIATAIGLVDGYCRGRSRTPDGKARAGIREVVLTVAARLAFNPGQSSFREQSGAVTEARGAGFTGFTLAEQYILNRYRKRAI